MLLFSARRSSQGFTLIEILVVVAMVGILSAIAAPSFLAYLNRAKVREAQTKVLGALKESQRESMRKSRNDCQVNIPSGNNQSLTGNCLVTGDRNLKETLKEISKSEDISIRRTNSISSITFNFRGGTGNSGTIVLALPNGTSSQQKCLVIAAGIGIMRTGDYDKSDTTGTDPALCTTSQYEESP